MSTMRPSESVMAEAAQAAAERPTPEDIDAHARVYLELKQRSAEATEAVKLQEDRIFLLIQTWGTVPANAEKSRRLSGRLSELTLTKADTITVNDERVETLREALEANERSEFFARLFTLRSKYEIVDGAESALKAETLPKRLAEKVLNLFGRCITVKAKKPSLKVVLADPAKPAKKSRAKKGGTQ